MVVPSAGLQHRVAMCSWEEKLPFSLVSTCINSHLQLCSSTYNWQTPHFPFLHRFPCTGGAFASHFRGRVWSRGGVASGWGGSLGPGSGQALSNINNAPTAKLLAGMRNVQQLRCLSSSAEASLRQCWLEIAITPNPLFSGCHSGITFPLSWERAPTWYILSNTVTRRLRRMFTAQQIRYYVNV